MKKTNLFRKMFWLLLTLGFATVCFASYGDKEGDDGGNGDGTTVINPGIGEPTATTDPGVVINGVRWATRNLDTGGKFVANATDHGALYQWGRPADGHEDRNSDTTTTLSGSDTPGHSSFISPSSLPYDWRSSPNDALWNAGTETAPVKAANDPSPNGWRVPTNAEFEKLLDDTKVTRAWDDTKKGYTFIDIASGESVFFPAAGYRLDSVGTEGYYWSSTQYSIGAYILGFDSSFAGSYCNARVDGLSVRCVAE